MVWLRVTTCVALGLALLLIGCGTDSRENKLRPPAAITVSVKIGPSSISLSPKKIGAGPTRLIVSNQSGSDEKIVITGGQIERGTREIANLDTDEIEIDLKPGDYDLTVGESTAVEPATLRVTSERPSAQNDLLLP